MDIRSSDGVLGASVEGLDLRRLPAVETVVRLRSALGDYGVLCFPGQQMDPGHLRDFGRLFGRLENNVANQFHAPGMPEVMILSNMTVDGQPIGLGDAGQGWHTDMSYSRQVGLASLLHAITVPVRDGRSLGDTQFRNMHAAYTDLPDDLKRRLSGRTATHDFVKFWDMMRRRAGSNRAPLTAQQRARKPPVSHPIFRTHPITGRKVLYCNPGYATRIDGMTAEESEETLAFLFAHQQQDKYLHVHSWREGDLLMWDTIGTTHNAVADYGTDEPRFMRRVQVIEADDGH